MRAVLFAALSTLMVIAMPASADPQDMAFRYVGLYVKDVPRSVAFYEKAFGLKRRFITEAQEYGEMATGETRLGFVNGRLVERISKDSAFGGSDGAPSGSEISFVTADVAGAYDRAIAAGATPVSAPAKKPWGQTVSYVRDPDGHLVGICSALP